MKKDDYVSELLTGKELEVPERSKAKAEKLKKQAGFGFDYVKY